MTEYISCSIQNITSSGFISTLVACDGGLGKGLLHGVTGGIYSSMNGGSFASGLVGGTSSELVSPLLSLQEHQKYSGVIGAGASALAGGKAKEMQLSSSISSSLVENNRRMHPEELKILSQLEKEAETEEEKQRIRDTGAYWAPSFWSTIW